VIHTGGRKITLTLKNWLYIPCYEYHLYLSEGQISKYIHVLEGENIQRTPLEKYNNRTD
jgi:hypothetical protein